MSSLSASFFLTTALFFVHIAYYTTTAARVLHSGAGPLFSYLGTSGPADWGHLSPAYYACSAGKLQSPIDIDTSKVVQIKTLRALTVSYYPANATLINNGFNVEMKLGDGGRLIADGKIYKLTQMHWHAPSEHKINGVRMDAELHLVHTASDGNTTVVAMFYRIGAPDPFLGQVLGKVSHLDSYKKDFVPDQLHLGAFDTKGLGKSVHLHRYYKYVGSLTTPPCTENVVWRVLTKERNISSGQIAALRAPLLRTCKRNARPSQPLNGRRVTLFEEKH